MSPLTKEDALMLMYDIRHKDCILREKNIIPDQASAERIWEESTKELYKKDHNIKIFGTYKENTK